jgi:hypothetical protein
LTLSRVARIIGVTIGLVAGGIVFGAIAGGTAFWAVALITEQGTSLEAFEIGAAFGAPLGALTAPLLAWLLLRHVPIGKMFLVCSAGTAVGGMVGWFATLVGGDILLNPLLGAFIGCLIAAIALWYRVQHA